MKFSGTSDYISTKDLTIAVNAAITLERPLLVKGEPGTGKTELAKQVASSLGLEIFEWSIKSTTRAQQGLYEYDAVSRLRDSQIGDQNVSDISKYIKKGKIWNSFESNNKSVLLIDEIDKAVEALNKSWEAASQEIYKATQEQQAANGGAGADPSAKSDGPKGDGGDDISDVDFEEVKDEKK